MQGIDVISTMSIFRFSALICKHAEKVTKDRLFPEIVKVGNVGEFVLGQNVAYQIRRF